MVTPIVAADVRGVAFAASATRYNTIGGLLIVTNATEAVSQFTIRDTLTLANLYVRVIANAATSGATTVKSRKNTANGTQSVSIPFGQTGVFKDTSNSDSLVAGDKITTQIIPAAGGTTTISLIGYTLSGNSGIFLSFGSGFNLNFGSTSYCSIAGDMRLNATESRSQYTVRETFSSSNFQVYVGTNTLDGATQYYLRKNGVNGNQSVNFNAGITGFMEDTTSTDSFVTGDKINYGATTAGTTGAINTRMLGMKHNLAGGYLINGTPGLTTIAAAATVNLAIGGNPQFPTGTEADSQILAQTPFTAKNLFVNIPTNSVNGTTTVRLRKNTANGNLNVSIAASITGTFEDTTNTDSLISTDVINFQIITGGTTGSMQPTYVGVEVISSAVKQLAALGVG